MRHEILITTTASGVSESVRVLAVVLCAGFSGCSGAGETRGENAPLQPAAAPVLPEPAGRFTPAHSQLAEDSRIRGSSLARIGVCARCHPGAYQQWSSSAHAFASFNNPVYRDSVDRFRAAVSRRASRFCAGCHDIALLVDGAMDGEVAPADPRAHAGVNCRICHGIERVAADGNGSYQLRSRPIPIPDMDDPDSVDRHVLAVSVRGLSSELCLTCHRSFLGPDTGNEHHLSGMDEFSDWQRSAHAGQGLARIDDPVEPRDCVDCHMAAEPVDAKEVAAKDGKLSSHRFLGGHTWLARMRTDEAQQARVQAMLQNVMSIDIAAAITRAPRPADRSAPRPDIRTLPADGAPVIPGGQLSVDVVVRNLGVGHRFPGGVRDAQDAWIEVTVADARGRLLAASGLAHRTDADDTEAHVLRTLTADEHGVPKFTREVNEFRSAIVDHTIAPRDAAVVRYVMDVPESFAQPLVVKARLLHRSRNLALQRAACAAATSRDGLAFGRASQKLRGQSGQSQSGQSQSGQSQAGQSQSGQSQSGQSQSGQSQSGQSQSAQLIDACVEQPVTTMAETHVRVGQAGDAPADDHERGQDAGERLPRPDWRRLYEHGMAWTHAVQERLDEARPSLLRALELVRDGPARHQAAILAALGRLSGRQGRTDEALELLDRAEALMPGHPALAAIRGAALARVWRWQEAEAPLSSAAEAAPDNAGAWVNLAIARGSLGWDRGALDAARRGLTLEPRHPDLLRVQALALRGLHAASDEALAAYDRFRKPDRAVDIRFACAARSEMCAREREPVHAHRLLPVDPLRSRR